MIDGPLDGQGEGLIDSPRTAPATAPVTGPVTGPAPGPAAYTGRRRAGGRGQARIVFVAVLIVVATVAVALRGLAAGPPDRAALNAEPAGPVVPTGDGPTTAGGPGASAGPSHSASARPSATHSASASPGASGSAGAPPGGSPSVTVAPSASAQPSGSTGGTAPGVVYEAEAAGNGRPSPMTVRAAANASGGRAVTSVGNGRMLSFTGVDVAQPGEYTVTIAYLSTDERRCYVGIGRGWQPLTFPASGGLDRVATVTVRLQFSAGRNTVEAGNTPGRWCPDLDRITVAPR